MRRKARLDANHNQIVDALRTVGALVTSLAQLGNGVPDLLVVFRGKIHLLEVKDGRKPKSARELTEDEEAWFILNKSSAPDLIHIVCDEEQALRAIGAI